MQKDLKQDLPRILLIGNPNVGKSVIFEILTGRYVSVANYPGTTIKVTHGIAIIKDKKWKVMDTPGINNIIPMNEDEIVTRNILMNERYSALVQIADAKNLERGLLLSIQLIEMGLSFLLDLNLMDEALSRGIYIDIKKLSRKLGIQVCETVAIERQGISKITKFIEESIKREPLWDPKPGLKAPQYPPDIEETIQHIQDRLPKTRISKRSLSLMLLSEDKSLIPWVSQNLSSHVCEKITRLKRTLKTHYTAPLFTIINQHRIRYVKEIAKDVRLAKKRKVFVLKWVKRQNFLERFTLHPVWGMCIMGIVLFLSYLIIAKFGVQILGDFLQSYIFGNLGEWIKAGWEPKRFPLLRDFLVGSYGQVTMALNYGLGLMLPIVTTFFFIFSILEDSGYLPRFGVITNSLLRQLRLSGQAVLPMTLGLGCTTVATLATRIIPTKKDRIVATFLLALGIPCSAQLGVIIPILISTSFQVTFLWLAIIICTIGISARLSSRLIPGKHSFFILELPPLRFPHFHNLIKKTFYRLRWYLKEALPLFILGTSILFIFSQMKVLNFIHQGSAPFMEKFLGLPPQAIEAFMLGFFKRDLAALSILRLFYTNSLNETQLVVALVTTTLFVPCIANLIVIIKEQGLKIGLLIISSVLCIALFIGGITNLFLKFLTNL
jgi:ferrous iron transport protein B